MCISGTGALVDCGPDGRTCIGTEGDYIISVELVMDCIMSVGLQLGQ